MIPPNQGSSLFQDYSSNMIPKDNCYISGYKGPNEIYQEFIERKQNVIYVVKVLDPEYKIVTRGSPYNFAMLNSP